jgi:hypothetical protein
VVCADGGLPLPARDAGALQRRLYDEYHVEVPVTEWNGSIIQKTTLRQLP